MLQDPEFQAIKCKLITIVQQIISRVRSIFGTAKPALAGDEADEIFDLKASTGVFDPGAETLAGIAFQKSEDGDVLGNLQDE